MWFIDYSCSHLYSMRLVHYIWSTVCSLVPRPPPVFCSSVSFSILHGSRRARKRKRFHVLYWTKPKNGGGLGMRLYSLCTVLWTAAARPTLLCPQFWLCLVATTCLAVTTLLAGIPETYGWSAVDRQVFSCLVRPVTIFIHLMRVLVLFNSGWVE